MRVLTLAVALVAAVLIIFAVKSPKPEEAAVAIEAAEPQSEVAQIAVSPLKSLTSASCASDGCPLSCQAGDTLLSAICVSGSKGRFADTLRVEKGALTATCGTGADTILVYCGHP